MDPYRRRYSETSDTNESFNQSESESFMSDPESEMQSIKEASENALGQRETTLVQGSKVLVYLMLFFATVAMATATFTYIRQEELNDYSYAFESFADEIFAVADSNALEAFGVVKSLATSVSSFARGAKMTWPNVTVLDFEARSEEARINSGAELISFMPIVSNASSDSLMWEGYAKESQGWIHESLAYLGVSDDAVGNVPVSIHSLESESLADTGDNVLSIRAPVWQIGPIPSYASTVMLDAFSIPWFNRLATDVLAVQKVVLSEVLSASELQYFSSSFLHDDQPRSMLLQPIFESLKEDSFVVGFILAAIPWETYFKGLLPLRSPKLEVRVADGCGTNFRYEINGPEASFIDDNEENLSPRRLKDGRTYEFAVTARYQVSSDHSDWKSCNYSLSVFPTREMEDHHMTLKPYIYTVVVVTVFIFTAIVFLFYDSLVQHRQKKVLHRAERSNAIVSSLFPETVRERMLHEANGSETRSFGGAKDGLKQFLRSDSEITESESFSVSRPIADLFLDTTVLFADIVGFTAWSSTREPTQVFTLLETIYHEFDELARRRRVFKVETVGDCYVAVTGLPEPRRDHALAMARFACDCLHKMCDLMKRMETTLGPDTGDLGMRFGLHSGPVTAGVLRGDRARFQLFGDTVNTAARMESTGRRNMIQISQETANQLMGFGKLHWLYARADRVCAKGKGELQTFWLDVKVDANSMDDDSDHASKTDASTVDEGNDLLANRQVLPGISEKQARLVRWNTDVLARLLRAVVARRRALGLMPDEPEDIIQVEQAFLARSTAVLHEVAEIITLPKFDDEAAEHEQDIDTIELGDDVLDQLHNFLQTICVMYRNNPFHNFEHASHVAMSVTKLLSRIVAPDISEFHDPNEKTLHDHTYGITSDPLTQFACIFSALIHDVDHPGVPNSQLIKEEASVATAYDGKSVAEQNSVDIAWELLMDESYEDLRNVIYTSVDELRRFRQLVVNSVMATDIMDKDLGAARKARWNKAFAEGFPRNNADEETNRKATIVIEHLIQASDVAHTMQHWHIYRKWNERLFKEIHLAYTQGRAEKDPADGWYEGEIGFFDFYLIPLAKKLKDCGVFGVSSDEYLNYAQQNREEWINRGQEIVAEMVEDVQQSLLEESDSMHGTEAQ